MPAIAEKRSNKTTDNADEDASIGARLRKERKAQNLSLATLSQMTGVSIGGLSQIERGANSPSIRTLRSIVDALDLSIGDLFSDNRATESLAVDFVVRSKDRQPLSFWRTGIRKELLTNISLVDIELLLVSIDPEGGTGDSYTHRGEEAGIVLEGRLELTVEDQVVLLDVGDAFGFKSVRPHSFRNGGKDPCKVLWINTGNHKEV